MTIASDFAMPNSSNEQSHMTVMTLYMGIVLTIANFLKMMFKDSSKRIVWEEMESTSLLMELCDGVYLARIQGNLQVEYNLYHELIGIYRSTEMLTHVSKSRTLAIGDSRILKMPPNSRKRTDASQEMTRTKSQQMARTKSQARRKVEDEIPTVASSPPEM